jgi:hypothetical protein
MNLVGSNEMVKARTAVLAGFLAIFVAALAALGWHYLTRPISIRGATIQQDGDPKMQSPIQDVVISVAGDPDAAKVKSDFSGYFKLTLHPRTKRGEPLTLEFRHPEYQPVDLEASASSELYVVRMVPLHRQAPVQSNLPNITVANVFLRYAIETTATVNIGTGVKTFEIPNKGNVPCQGHPPCSPDNKWKAAIGGASLDAGQGNVFQNARVSCIAGPCPFTEVESDHFSQGGRSIEVSVRSWSDTTTFLFQAEVFRQEANDIIRESYPVIFGPIFNFTLPGAAEGPSLEAELNGARIVFPLGPSPILSWANCGVKVGKDNSKSYRCELKPGYHFQSPQ